MHFCENNRYVLNSYSSTLRTEGDAFMSFRSRAQLRTRQIQTCFRRDVRA